MKSETIIRLVCKEFGVKRAELAGVTRRSEIVEARQVAFYLMRKLMKSSYRVIGKALVRDHTTVGFGYRQIQKRVRRDEVLEARIERLKKELLRSHK